MNPDLKIKVTLLTESEGGRKTPIKGERFGCPLKVDGKAFECRFVIDGSAEFDLGESYEIGIKLMSPDLAKPLLQSGKAIELWEGKTIAVGEVLEVFL